MNRRVNGVLFVSKLLSNPELKLHVDQPTALLFVSPTSGPIRGHARPVTYLLHVERNDWRYVPARTHELTPVVETTMFS